MIGIYPNRTAMQQDNAIGDLASDNILVHINSGTL